MVASTTVAGELETARRLVGLLQTDGFDLDVAIWAVDEDGRGRLFLVPRNGIGDTLEQMVRVATTISTHRDELPDRHDLRYSVVNREHPIVRAVADRAKSSRQIFGLVADGIYYDMVQVLTPSVLTPS
jgi:hypothetical protein